MQIHHLQERPNRAERQQEIGFVFADIDGKYWDECFGVEFSSKEIDTLEQAANECHVMAMRAAAAIIDSGNDADLLAIGIPQKLIPLIRESWKGRDSYAPALYGRFDFALNFEAGVLVPKCYEYNADTPTSLFESSIVQWQWLQDMGLPDQFNSIHEQLVERWQTIERFLKGKMYFTAMPTREDWSTALYLAETAQEAGIAIAPVIDVREIALPESGKVFLDVRDDNKPEIIESIFKLYPWEYLITEAFGNAPAMKQTQWLEPAWKLVLSSKGLLAKMYELFPKSPWLLPTHLTHIASMSDYVIKPCLSREGSGVQVFMANKLVYSNPTGEHDVGQVVQAYCPSYKIAAEGTIMAGVWIVGDVACGLGVRLDGDITGNAAKFLPHFFA